MPTGESPVNYLVNLFEPDAKRCARQMNSLRNHPVGNMIATQDRSEETIVILTEERIDRTLEIIKEINEALDEERQLKADWRKATSKLKQDDRVVAEAWFTQLRTETKLDELALRIQDLKREHNNVLADSRSKMREAKRVLQAQAAAAMVISHLLQLVLFCLKSNFLPCRYNHFPETSFNIKLSLSTSTKMWKLQMQLKARNLAT